MMYYIRINDLQKKEKYFKIIKLLIKSGTNLNIKTNYNYTLLTMAIQSNDVEVVKLFIKYGANINKKNGFGETPLMIALHGGFRVDEIIKLLIKSGAKMNLRDNYGDTALHQSCELKNNKLLVKYLIRYGCNVNQLNSEKETPLFNAVNFGSVPVYKILIQAGVNINARNANNQNVLMRAINSTNTKSVRKLLKYGADINMNDLYGIKIGTKRIYDIICNFLKQKEWDTCYKKLCYENVLKYIPNVINDFKFGWGQTTQKIIKYKFDLYFFSRKRVYKNIKKENCIILNLLDIKNYKDVYKIVEFVDQEHT